MHENGFQSGEGRGRGRGRGRGLWRPPNPDTERGRGMWMRANRSSYPPQGSSLTSKSHWHQNVTSSQPVTSICQQVKKEDWQTLSLLANPPPPPPKPTSELSSPPKIPTIQQIAAHSPPPPPPLPPSAQSSDSSLSSNISHPPKPLLTYNFSPSRRPVLSKQVRPQMESNIRHNIPPLFVPEEIRLNFHNQLKNVRSQLAQFSQKGGRFPAPQQNNRSLNLDSHSNQTEQQRRANKRPVTSPTNVANDVSLPQKNVRSSGPQNKKKKRKRKPESEPVNKDNKNKSLVNADLIELKVDENKNFAEQAKELISKLEQTEVERKMRLEVLKDVAETFSPYLPFVEPQIYGSTLTNIAFKSSDLDIFLYCPKGQPEYNFVLEKGRLMYKTPKFTNIVRVPRARVPVIKATHVETNIDVDISTMSGQAVYNSLLIKHILSIDSRLRPLAMLISLWSKLNTITGHSRFTSYSIVLMILYYLQKITPPILPPLKDILYSNEENDWPNFFSQKTLESKNTSDLAQLFKGFFVFYVNFNFEETVISPYLGKEIPVSHFKNIEELTDDFKVYTNKIKDNVKPFMINHVIHVQDPIEHNVNTSKGVFRSLLKLFRRSCERLLQNCNDRSPQNRWLPIILKQPPLKLFDEKKYHLILNYPVKGENWFEKCKKDFRELLKILLIRISEEEFEHDIESNGGKHKDSFFAEANYNVFNKKFRFPLRMYMSGTIHLNELQKQFEIVVNRIQSPPVLFKTKFTLEEQNANGRVKVTITDKNTTGLNSFMAIANEFKRYCGKFLTDIVSNNTTSEESIENNAEVVVMDLETDIKQTPVEEHHGPAEKDIVKDSQHPIDSFVPKKVEDDAKEKKLSDKV